MDDLKHRNNNKKNSKFKSPKIDEMLNKHKKQSHSHSDGTQSFSLKNHVNLSEQNSSAFKLEKDSMIKVVVVGESGSGKSNLIQRFVYDRFDERSPSTIGIDFALYEFKADDKTYHAQIWDTAGMERYRSSITNIFYRDACGVMLIFDLTKRDHFQALAKWLHEIRLHVHPNDQNLLEDEQSNVPIILVGNKLDLINSREIETPEAIKFAQKNHLDGYIETSAKNNINVQEVFTKLLSEILDRQKCTNESSTASKNRKKSQKKTKYLKLTRNDPHYHQNQKTCARKPKNKGNCAC